MDMAERNLFFEKVLKIRKAKGWEALRQRCYEQEPAFVLGLPDKPSRQAYLARVEQRFGGSARATLEARVRALWQSKRVAVPVESNA